MKKNLLKMSALLLLMMLNVSLFAATVEGETVFTSIKYSVDGNILEEGDEVVIGSTITWEAQVSIPDDSKEYKLGYWPLGPKGGNNNVYGWLGAPANKVVNHTETVFTGSFTYAAGQDAGNGHLRLIQQVDGGDNIYDSAEDFSIQWVENNVVPDHVVNSIVLKDSQGNTIQEGDDILLGSTFSYEVSCTVPDDGAKYEVWVMQWGALENNPSNITWIKTNKKVITEEAGVAVQAEPVTGDWLVNATNVAGDVNCVASSGYLLCRIYKDGARLTPDAEETFAISWTDGTTDVFNENSQELSVYPNPATSFVNIKANQGSAVEVINVAGALVKSYVATTDIEKLEIGDLIPGLYVVKVSDNGVVKTEKLIVK